MNLREKASSALPLFTVNPLAHWTFEDCFDYVFKYQIELHPSVARGYPCHGDARSTLPVPADASVKYVNFQFVGRSEMWLDYGCEHKGRR
eukprot:CAMPEP_0173059338 /NCGR_PEP_ID=MMETSP1102-20130122/1911_1 /TAXON_ID=49646 /ORGANISM="Geminigera sp., Strain Caron Lab Isolate" /LENGTH=89 /DNA_ID=CAMNT_0013925295 /DNA_START=132 /DNA_END=401 /DNA_ORIENTATION=+